MIARIDRSSFLLVSSFSDRAHATLFLEGDTGADATPLSILSSSVYPIRQPLSRPLPTRYIFQLRDRPTYTYQQLSSLPVMLLKGMNCSSVERNWCYLEARFAIYHYSKLFIFDLWRGCRVEGRLWRKDCLIRGQICFDTGRGIDAIKAIIISVLEMLRGLIPIKFNFMILEGGEFLLRVK